MKNRSTQSDTNMDFDGMARTGTGRVNQKMHTNQWSGHMNDGREVNMGRGPTRGNMGCGKPGKPGAMASVTKDSFRAAPTDSVPGMKIRNPDMINAGAQVRTPGGTRTWDPKCGQNYAGNPDKIRMGQSGGGTFNREGPSKTPSTSRGQTNFNYGPKSQY
jgi:hypothetical protein